MSKKPKGWYKEIVLRPVVHVDGYESYEKICSYIADAYYAAIEDEKKLRRLVSTNPKESLYISSYALFKVGQAKCPAYWVAKDLLEALIQSNLDVEIANLKWAMKAGILMLPKGMIASPDNSSIDTILWHYDIDDNYLYWIATDKQNVFSRQLRILDNLKTYRYASSNDINPKIVTDFNDYLQSIFLRLILMMECRPELVDREETQQKITINQGFGKAQAQDFYQPLWIGQNYRLKREVRTSSDGGTKQGSTKSPHWRKGFIRNQPYGEGKQQRKFIWIEPVLVMGGD